MVPEEIESEVESMLNEHDVSKRKGMSEELAAKYPRLHSIVASGECADDDVRSFLGLMLQQLRSVENNERDMESATRSVGQAVISRYHNNVDAQQQT